MDGNTVLNKQAFLPSHIDAGKSCSHSLKFIEYGDEKFTWDIDNKAIYVDHKIKKSRAVFWVNSNGSLTQKTKAGCSARGLLLAHRKLVTG